MERTLIVDDKKKIKIIALDVYGTILPTKGMQVKRKGLDTLLQKCKNQGLTLCTSSDANTSDMLKDFKKAGLDSNYFDKFFEMKRKGKRFYELPKNFTPILKYYNLDSEELLVIGDKIHRDIMPAQDLGCKTILVPEYKIHLYNEFDLNNLSVF